MSSNILIMTDKSAEFQLVKNKKTQKKKPFKKSDEELSKQEVPKQIQREDEIKPYHVPKVDEKSRKRILCFNMYTTHSCPYIDCVYAHNLGEQKVDAVRKRAYDIIKGTKPLNDLDLIHDRELYLTLLKLSRLCYSCAKESCLGGYNCKNGSYTAECVVCYNDLNYGKCYTPNCNKVHLTKRGLVNYKLQEMIENGYHKDNEEMYVDNLVNAIPPAIELNKGMIEELCSEHLSDELNSIDSLSNEELVEQDSCDEIILHVVTD